RRRRPRVPGHDTAAGRRRRRAVRSASPVRRSREGSNRMTVGYVFVHGGGASGGFWDRLLPVLDAPAVAVNLPGRAGKPFDPMTFTVDEGVQSAVEDVKAADLPNDLVLVAHSSGGLFVPGITAALAPRVQHIVLSAASVPPEGGLGLDAMKPS